ncbi:hypothetical protein EON66_03715 [archaeon]|nr:MAG: hypothetical protein EON66_03715 [archaeon]
MGAPLRVQLIKPKTMQGAPVTGRMLGGLATAYVAAINAHAVPSIGNAWDGVTRVECKVGRVRLHLRV